MATTMALNKLQYFWFLMIFITICMVLYLLDSGGMRQYKDGHLHNPAVKHRTLLDLANNTNVTFHTFNDGYKKILFWNSYYIWPDYKFGFGRKPFLDSCTEAAGFYQRRCETTSNRSELDSSDAVVFHIRDIDLEDFPKKRRPEQVWVFFLKEPPTLTNVPNDKKLKLNGIFNWTMTYRRDSDVPNPYFKIIRKLGYDTVINVTNISKGERRLVAWLVSHCETPSKREKYVEELKQFIPIDVYGECGTKCPGNSNKECLDFIFSHYKFYLAFENSLCNDYVTEKFSNALERGVVPIVYGGADYNAIAPLESFINTKDFQSPQKLAEYIRLLDSTDALYLNYFRWRQDYKLFRTYKFCYLCEMLHNTDMSLSFNHKVYDDMVSWWYTKGDCH